MTAEQGRSGVVRDALGQAAAELERREDPEQLDLGILPTRFHGEKAEEQRKIVSADQRARGAGRPPGAQNLATRDVKAFVRKLFGDPMIDSARWLMHTPQTMAKELGCTIAEAFDRQEAIRRDLRPYFYARLAPVGEDGQPVPFLQMILGGQGGEASTMPPWLMDPEVKGTIEGEIAAKRKVEENQGVSDAADDVSHGESRTDDASD